MIVSAESGWEAQDTVRQMIPEALVHLLRAGLRHALSP